jgi:hypothetical protein
MATSSGAGLGRRTGARDPAGFAGLVNEMQRGSAEQLESAAHSDTGRFGLREGVVAMGGGEMRLVEGDGRCRRAQSVQRWRRRPRLTSVCFCRLWKSQACRMPSRTAD